MAEAETNQLLQLLRAHYGLSEVSLRFLREGGSRTYLVEGEGKYLLKLIGAAFADTARQSVSVSRYLEDKGFPVPETLLTRSGEPLLRVRIAGEDRLLALQTYVQGEEPDLTARAEEAGALTGELHRLLEAYPEPLTLRDESFFIGRYLDFLRQRKYPRLSAYAELGEMLWERVRDQGAINCHGDLHRGNLLETPQGRLYLLDFDTVCRAPAMFDVMVMCDMTDYFRLTPAGIETARAVYRRFLTGYSRFRTLSGAEVCSFPDWVALRHFQLQATILEIHGLDCVKESFIDAQLKWLEQWLRAAKEEPYGE